MGDELLMGRYRLGERLGAGGAGVVHRAFDERLQRPVAVKEVATERSRIVREAQAAARLNHPGIVTLYELGERHGRAILVSELVEGETLDRLRASGRLSDREVGQIGAELCDALVHAHGSGVVHRDLKPQNVIVRDAAVPGSRAKLLDFGIASLAGAPTLTGAGEVVGTLAYMSPEQAAGEPAGPESDVYSLALTLYECWAGANPVAGRNAAETARRIGRRVPPLAVHRPDLPASACELIDACLDPDPARRPTAIELGDGLERVLGALDPAAPVPGPRLRRRRGVLAALGVARIATILALAAGVAAVAALGAGGLALVLAACGLPAIIAAPSLAALAAPAAPGLAALGLAGAAPVAAALARRGFERAVLGAAGWAWIAAASLGPGLGPRLGLGPRAPAGWPSDPATAADAVLAPLLEPRSLAAAAVFAAAALSFGWILARAHLAVALVATLIWAACLDAALLAVAEPLGGRPLGIVFAAGAAIAIEFGVLRAAGPRAPVSEGPLGGRPGGLRTAMGSQR